MTTKQTIHGVTLETVPGGWRAQVDFRPPKGEGFSCSVGPGTLESVTRGVKEQLEHWRKGRKADTHFDDLVDDWNQLLDEATGS